MTKPRPKKDREPNDEYMTPRPLALAICRYLDSGVRGISVHKFGTIVEPSAGDGSFVEAAREVWPRARIVAGEISKKFVPKLVRAGADIALRWDFLSTDITFPKNVNLVIGNPPYGRIQGVTKDGAQAHVRAAYDRMPQGAVLAYLLRMAFLTGTARAADFYPSYPLWGLAPIAGRPSFTGGSEQSEYGLFIWVKGARPQWRILPHLWWRDGKAEADR